MAMLGTPKTLVEALALTPRDETRGFRFFGTDNKEHYFSYVAMEREAHRRAALLASLGLKKGDRLAMVIPEGHEFVLTFFGACVAGIVPVPIFPRASFKGIDGYVDTIAHIASAARANVLLTMESTKPYVEKILERDSSITRIELTSELFAREAPSFTPPVVLPEELCFLQFTSGSTSKPKGVMVTHANLVANATSFLGPAGLDRREDDVGVSWLPLYHDMGLIGFALGTLIADIPAVLLPTSTFARGPKIWLETIAKYRGTITFAPNFAYALAAKRIRERDLTSLDLSCLRIAGCGAEPIHAQTMRDFSEKLAPAGFNPNCLLPSYGMAEATLAITFHQRGAPILVDVVDADAMKRGEATPATANTEKSLEVVSCGVAFPGHEVAIIDDAGTHLGERRVGQIIARGPSITSGYYENPEATAQGWKDGWLQTGDLGYFADGNLYICGRAKDLIIINGANFYPQDIEWALQDLEGIRRGNVVAFSIITNTSEQLVIAAEAASTDAERLRQEIPAKVYDAFGLTMAHCAIVAVGTLPKTSSGKAQRLKTKQHFEDGLLAEHGTSRAAEGHED